LHDYDCRKIDGTSLTQEQIENIFQKLRQLTAPARLTLPGITAGREDVILGGVIMVREVLRCWQKPAVLISDRGLRFGVILAECLRAQQE